MLQLAPRGEIAVPMDRIEDRSTQDVKTRRNFRLVKKRATSAQRALSTLVPLADMPGDAGSVVPLGERLPKL